MNLKILNLAVTLGCHCKSNSEEVGYLPTHEHGQNTVGFLQAFGVKTNVLKRFNS